MEKIDDSWLNLNRRPYIDLETHQERHFLSHSHFTACRASRSGFGAKGKVNLSVANDYDEESKTVDGQYCYQISNIERIAGLHWQANAVKEIINNVNTIKGFAHQWLKA